MRSNLLRMAARTLPALATLALGACGDHPNPIEASPGGAPSAIIVPGDDPPPPGASFRSVSISSTTLVIDSTPSVTYSATFEAATSLSGVVLVGDIIQGSASRQASVQSVRCGFSPGQVVKGTCTDGGLITVSNSALGTGTLVPGSATFRVQLRSFTTTIDSWSIPVTLRLPKVPRISALSLPNPILLDQNNRYTAAIENPGPATLTEVATTGHIIQGSANHLIAESATQCGTVGVVAAGTTCTITANPFVSRFSSADSPGTLTSGAATVEIDLLGRINGGPRQVLDKKIVQLSLAFP